MLGKELYIIRHGQTDHNARGIVQGKGVDLPLNETGRKQSYAFFKAYRHIPFDVIYTSTLKRAQESIEPFKALGIKHEIYSELDEISWGDLEGTISTYESDLLFQTLLMKWRSGEIHEKPSPTGESPYELQQRQKKFMDMLLLTPYKKILIATHGRFIRAFMCTITQRPLSEMENFKHINLCLYKVNQKLDGGFEIELNCEQKHLIGL